MNRRVLVVDDEPIVLSFCVRALETQGYSVRTALSGEEALGLLARESFDVLATDIRMPGMSGIDLMDRVAALGLDLPVIVITALGTLDNSIQALRAGAVDFVTKPFGRQELAQAVAHALLQARLARERARLRLLSPVLELARQVRQGAGVSTVCNTLVDLAIGQPGARGAAILLEELGQGDSHVVAARGVLLGLSALEAEALPVAFDGELCVRATVDLAGVALRDRLLQEGVNTLVVAALEGMGTHYGELWIALDSPPDRLDAHYAEAITSLARHATNLISSARMMRPIPSASAV